MNVRNALKTSLLVILISAGILSEPVVFAMQSDHSAISTSHQVNSSPGQYAQSLKLLQNLQNVAELNKVQNPVNAHFNHHQSANDPFGLNLVKNLDPQLRYNRGSLFEPLAWAGLAALLVVPGARVSDYL